MNVQNFRNIKKSRLVSEYLEIFKTSKMLDSDSIREKIDTFGRRIGILNRFFSLLFDFH